MSKSEYLKLADAIAAEIADGTLKPGDRLPPQRNFAYERKIAVSTAGRVYAELLRRGLVVGEVGRGTFISGDARRGVAAPSERERLPGAWQVTELRPLQVPGLQAERHLVFIRKTE